MTKALTKGEQVAEMRGLLTKMEPEFKKMLAKHLTTERFMRVVLNSCQKTPALLKCNRESFFARIMDCAALGLEPDSPLQHCHLIPFKDTCTLIMGYRGMIELAERADAVKSWRTVVVRAGDYFEVEEGTEPRIVHRPKQPEEGIQRGKAVAFYSVIRNHHGEIDFEVMWRDEVDAIRKRSRAKDSGPWKTDFDEMGRKTVMRRHAKRIRMSDEFRRAEELDNEQYPQPQDADYREIPLHDGDKPSPFEKAAEGRTEPQEPDAPESSSFVDLCEGMRQAKEDGKLKEYYEGIPLEQKMALSQTEASDLAAMFKQLSGE